MYKSVPGNMLHLILYLIEKLILQFVLNFDLPVSGSVSTSIVGSSGVVRNGTGRAAIGP